MGEKVPGKCNSTDNILSVTSMK